MTLLISKRQMTLLSNHIQNQYIERMISRIYAKFPSQAALQKKEEIRGVLMLAIDRAGSYEITGEGHVTRYIEYMYALGFDFDVNPKRPWARKILNAPDLNEEEKVEQLDAHIYFLEGR